MNRDESQQLVPGIRISASGEATIDASVSESLFDLAEELEDRTGLPVDVQHVLAALVLTARRGDLDSSRPISSDDPALIAVLSEPVKEVFSGYGGRVGRED